MNLCLYYLTADLGDTFAIFLRSFGICSQYYTSYSSKFRFKIYVEYSGSFAEAYDVMFNSSKSKLLFFGRSDSRSCLDEPYGEFKGSIIELVKHDKHIGNAIRQNISMHQIHICLGALNDKVNMHKSHFDHIDLDSLYLIFNT